MIHRDLKLENILMKGKVPANMEAKIGDFGLSALVDRKKGVILAKLASWRTVKHSPVISHKSPLPPLSPKSSM